MSLPADLFALPVRADAEQTLEVACQRIPLKSEQVGAVIDPGLQWAPHQKALACKQVLRMECSSVALLMPVAWNPSQLTYAEYSRASGAHHLAIHRPAAAAGAGEDAAPSSVAELAEALRSQEDRLLEARRASSLAAAALSRAALAEAAEAAALAEAEAPAGGQTPETTPAPGAQRRRPPTCAGAAASRVTAGPPASAWTGGGRTGSGAGAPARDHLRARARASERARSCPVFLLRLPTCACCFHRTFEKSRGAAIAARQLDSSSLGVLWPERSTPAESSE
ncbi:unnamed protein product [Prorocentrum cordatum]|uniref:Uncharacterized protein n=1 Tax=Prorocentrum cordatum TaxID=2364126 RepID=A0ABN9SUQ9_9DINO|nr:unnamed protein product [Polarella glacialis]